VEEAIVSYRRMLETKFANAGAVVLQYPDTPHEEVVRRIGAKRKPFAAETKEQGYKDYLIWQNVLQVAQTAGDPVAFVSNNKSDFADKDGQLHAHFVQDMEGLGMKPERITYFRDLRSCVEEIIKPDIELAATFRLALESNEPDGTTLRSAILDNVTKELLNSEIPAHAIGLPEGTDNVTIVAIDGEPQFSIESVRRLSTEESLVSLAIQAECSMDFFIDKSVLSWTDDDRIEIFEPDWNDRYAWAAATETMHGTLDITWNRRDAAVTSAEFEAHNPLY